MAPEVNARLEYSLNADAWSLGVVFFQGGAISSVLVGTTVKPLTDQHIISNEELAYIFDSTVSPISAVIAFNVWSVLVLALIFVLAATFFAPSLVV